MPGDYHVVLRTDVFNQLPESNETNNVRASLASFSLDLPQITLVAGHAEVDVEQFSTVGRFRSSIASARRRGRPLGLIPPGYRYRVSREIRYAANRDITLCGGRPRSIAW